MKNITVSKIIELTGGELLAGNKDEICDNFSKDTRELTGGEIYVGIKGDNFDGNTLYEKALELGAKGCIIENVKISDESIKKYKEKIIIKVDNTIEALQKIAKYKRSLYNIPVIAITGSVGKTSTKDMVYSVLSQKFYTLKTEGNYNNHIGLPFTILKLKDHEALVVEMGMNHFGEISVLTDIAKPNVAVITNVGTAHIGILGSRENILKAKLEILEVLDADGIVVINNDNDLLHSWYLENKDKYNIITYGIENDSDYMAEDVNLQEDGSKFILKCKKCKCKEKENTHQVENSKEINVPIPGVHFVQNSLCAISVGKIFNICFKQMKEGIETFKLSKRRMEISRLENGTTIINDCYNANLDSMKVAIEYLGQMNKKRKVAVLGDMLELGDYSKTAHEIIGEIVKKNNIDVLITVGEEAKNISKVAQNLGMDCNKIYALDTNEQAVELIKKIMCSDDIILFKASNGMHFDEIIKDII